MDLQTYLRTLRKSWWIILLVTLLGAAAAFGLNETANRAYASTVTFYVSTPTEAAGGNAYQANQYAVAKILSYSDVLKSDRLGRMIIESDKGIDLSSAQVANEISVATNLNTVVLTATVVDANSARSLRIASALSSQFKTLVDQLDNRTTSAGVRGSTVDPQILSGPTLNAVPVSPKVTRNLLLGVGAGLLLGILLALLRGLLDTSIRSLATLREVTGLPVLGSLYYDSAAKRTPILVGPAVYSTRAEAFRQLRTNLQFVHVGSPVHVLVVTSSVADEGKSTTAANLAILYAETGRRVLLIEGDMRKGRIAEYLGLEQAVGLSDVLAGNADVLEVLQTWNAAGLTVLLGGSVPPNPSELLGSPDMATLLGQLRDMFDVIVLDTPPLLPVTDAVVAATLADGVLLVVRQGKTSRSQVAASVRSLQAVDARVVGAVLSMVRKRSGNNEGYGYYTGAVKNLGDRSGSTITADSSASGNTPGRTTVSEHPALVETRLGRDQGQSS